MIENKKVLALIPARAGSKRVPGKNRRLLGGVPLIEHTVRCALDSPAIDRVLISTDDTELIAYYREKGESALVPFVRPEDLANDTATTFDVILHGLDWLRESGEGQFDVLALLQPTNPFRSKIHFAEAVDLLMARAANAVYSVCPLAHPIEWCNTLPEDRSMDNFIDPAIFKRSQDYKPHYTLNGAITLIDIAKMRKAGGLYLREGTVAYIMDRLSSLDIDVEEDFMLAEVLFPVLATKQAMKG